MFNVGGGEILVIALIALIILGPQRLPSAARQVGKAMGELRRVSSGFQHELRSAIDDSDQPATRPREVAPLGRASEASPGSGHDQAADRAVRAVSEQATPPADRKASSRATPRPGAASRPRTRREPLRAAPPPGSVEGDGRADPAGRGAS